MSNITDALPISKKDLMAVINAIIPSGAIMWFDLEEPPEGWEVYTPLIGRYPLGSTETPGTTLESAIPNIVGTFIGQTPMDGSVGPYKGAFSPNMESEEHINDHGSGLYSRIINFDASKCSDVYNSDITEVRPPSVRLLPCRKK